MAELRGLGPLDGLRMRVEDGTTTIIIPEIPKAPRDPHAFDPSAPTAVRKHAFVRRDPVPFEYEGDRQSRFRDALKKEGGDV